jgi:hypothetical protein
VRRPGELFRRESLGAAVSALAWDGDALLVATANGIRRIEPSGARHVVRAEANVTAILVAGERTWLGRDDGAVGLTRAGVEQRVATAGPVHRLRLIDGRPVASTAAGARDLERGELLARPPRGLASGRVRSLALAGSELRVATSAGIDVVDAGGRWLRHQDGLAREAGPLCVDGDRVFIGTRGEVKSKNLTNTSSLTTLAGGYGNGVLAIDADATGVVFGARTTQGAWIVASMARTGGTVTTLYTGTTLIRDIAIVGPNVVWLEANRIMRVARSGGAAAMVALVSDGTPWAVTSADGALFVATNQGVINPSGATGTILEVDPISGTKTELAKDQPEPHDVAVDADYVYWVNYGIGAAAGQIVRLKR